MPTMTKAAVLSRVTTYYRDRHSDDQRLAHARDLAYLTAAGMTYRAIVADVTTRDDGTTISTKTISLHLAALKDAGGEAATPETFGKAYRERHHASRTPKPKDATTGKAAPKDAPKDEAGTPGNTVTVTNASTAIAAFEALMRTVEALPARDRQRVTAHITRAMSRRFVKAA